MHGSIISNLVQILPSYPPDVIEFFPFPVDHYSIFDQFLKDETKNNINDSQTNGIIYKENDASCITTNKLSNEPFSAGVVFPFLCGTYKLVNGQTQEKTGQCLLGMVEVKKKDDSDGKLELKLIENSLIQVNQDAILDAKFISLGNDIPAVISADDKGSLNLYKIQEWSVDKIYLAAKWKESLIDNSVYSVCLSVDISNRFLSGSIIADNIGRTAGHSGEKMISSYSDGSMKYWDFHSGKLLSSWKAHDFETWCCAFDTFDKNIVYSGADEPTLKSWDMRMPSSSNVATYTLCHSDMGVTSIASHPRKPYLLASGSFDETVRLWDTRKRNKGLLTQFKRPKDMEDSCSKNSNAGGVWRLKWHPIRDDLLLGACMYDGVRIYKLAQNRQNDFTVSFNESHNHLRENDNSLDVELVNDGLNIATQFHYKGHSSLVYGADWINIYLGSADLKESEIKRRKSQIASDCVTSISNKSNKTNKIKIDHAFSKNISLIGSCSFYDESIHLWSYR